MAALARCAALVSGSIAAKSWLNLAISDHELSLPYCK